MSGHGTVTDPHRCLNALLNGDQQHHQTSSDTSVTIKQWEKEKAFKFDSYWRLSSQPSCSKSEPNNKKGREKVRCTWTRHSASTQPETTPRDRKYNRWSDLPGDVGHVTYRPACPALCMPPQPHRESTCADKALQARKTLPTCITQRDGAAARWEAQCTCVVSLANVIVQ